MPKVNLLGSTYQDDVRRGRLTAELGGRRFAMAAWWIEDEWAFRGGVGLR